MSSNYKNMRIARNYYQDECEQLIDIFEQVIYFFGGSVRYEICVAVVDDRCSEVALVSKNSYVLSDRNFRAHGPPVLEH